MRTIIANLTRLRTEARAAGVNDRLWPTASVLVTIALVVPFMVAAIGGGRA